MQGIRWAKIWRHHDSHWRQGLSLWRPGLSSSPVIAPAMHSCMSILKAALVTLAQDPVTGICHSDILVLDTKTWEWSSVEVVPLLLQIPGMLLVCQQHPVCNSIPWCRWRAAGLLPGIRTVRACSRTTAWWGLTRQTIHLLIHSKLHVQPSLSAASCIHPGRAVQVVVVR